MADAVLRDRCVHYVPGMPQEVRGVIARAKGEPVTIETIVIPDPGPGEAVVAIHAAKSTSEAAWSRRRTRICTPCADIARPPSSRGLTLTTPNDAEKLHPVPAR